MITAVIIDDEKKSRDVLKRLIKESDSQVVVLNEADSVESGYQVINEELPQLIFLDVEMLDGTGFNLLEKFDEIPFQVIFTTAYDKYAIKAFKYSALDYLLKPIDMEDLAEAIQRANNSIDEKMLINSQVKTLLNNRNSEGTKQKIVIKGASRLDFIIVEQICCCIADESYTKVVLENGDNLMAAKPLKHFDNMLKDDMNFTRVSKSALISMNHVKSYKKGQDLIVLRNGMEIAVSRRKKKDFLDRLDIF